MMPKLDTQWWSLITRALEEDSWEMDWTALGSVRDGQAKRAEIVAKADGVFYGAGMAEAAEYISQEIGYPIEMQILLKDGDLIKKGKPVVRFKGSARGILTIERPCLNLMSYLSGMSTRTRACLEIMKFAAKQRKMKTVPRLTPTRKTLPHYRDVAVAAVIAGGGHPHRTSLSGGILIKENHIRSAGSITQAIDGIRNIAPHGLKIEVEVTNLTEAREVIRAGGDAIMLDNFSPTEVQKALELFKSQGFTGAVEVSGGIHEGTIADYVLPGVTLISMGGLTNSVKAVDLSLLFEP